MRIVKPQNVVLQSEGGNALQFKAAGGEHLTISVLEPDIIRVQHLPEQTMRLGRTWMIVDENGQMPWEGRPRTDLSPFTKPTYTTTQAESTYTIHTDTLTIVLDTAAVNLNWHTADNGELFAADLPSRAYAYDGDSRVVHHYMVRRPDEHYYGFGEKTGELDKHGRRLRMFSVDALAYDPATTDPLYKHFPFYITLVPEHNIAYGILYDNYATATFDLGSEIDNYYGPYRYYQAEDGDIDYYFIYGPTIKEVVQKLARLTGRPVLPPRWSLGFNMSAWAPSEQPDAQQRLQELVDAFGEHEFPCSLYQLSSGYAVMEEEAAGGMTQMHNKRMVFHWNRQRVPDPQALADYFHQAGIRLSPNVKPGLLKVHPRFQEVAELKGFIQNPESGEPNIDEWWGGEAAHLDFTNPAAVTWWKEQVTTQMLARGMDVMWNDNNEYTIWNDEARCDGFGEPIRVGLIRPLHTLHMVRASYEAQAAHKPDERPFAISRSATIGTHRYAQTWSGDNVTSWHTLRYNIPMGLGMSLSNCPNTGHDVGGFAGSDPSPELLVRWVQNGIFHPRFCIHSWSMDDTYTTPWKYPETADLIRDLFHLRHRLLPYLYTLFFESARSGDPIIRPLVYQFQHDENVHTESFDFMLGDGLLIATVMEEGATTREVYLPTLTADDAGYWCNFHTGEWHAGGQTITAEAPLNRIPLFVPAGAIIPFGDIPTDRHNHDNDFREIQLFPHPETGRSNFTLIEDDGRSYGYQNGEFSEVLFDMKTTAESIHIDIKTPQLGYKLPYPDGELYFKLPQGENRPVTCSHHIKAGWTNEEKRHVSQVSLTS